MRKITTRGFLAVLIALSIVTLTGCSIFQSAQKRAQHHLAKAISLDPNIAQSRVEDSVRIKDSTVLSEKVRYKDTVITKTRDSVIIIPKTEISGNVTRPCDSTGKIRDFDYSFGSGANKVRIWSEDGNIRFNSSVDSLVSTIHSQETYINKLRDSIRSLEQKRDTATSSQRTDVFTVTETKRTVFHWIGLGTVVLTALYVILRALGINPGSLFRKKL